MWATTPTLLQLSPTPPFFSITRRRQRSVAASSKEVSGLDQLKSSPQTATNKGSVSKNLKELNGSDILLALQKASAKKAHKKVHKKNGNGSSLVMKKENVKRVVVDYDKVKPIVVKSDWCKRLDDLEKRLQEFQGF